MHKKRVGMALVVATAFLAGAAAGFQLPGLVGCSADDGGDLAPHLALLPFDGLRFDTDPGVEPGPGGTVNWNGTIRVENRAVGSLSYLAPNVESHFQGATGLVRVYWPGDPLFVCVGMAEP